MEHSCTNPVLTQADQTWLAAFCKAQATTTDFIIARIRNAPDLHHIAKQVICFVDGEFISVDAIEQRCSNHGWNSMVYEAWAWERQNAVHRFARRLRPVERDALLLHAHYVEPLDATWSAAQEALDEARRNLYGEDDECDDDNDVFEECDAFDLDEGITAIAD